MQYSYFPSFRTEDQNLIAEVQINEKREKKKIYGPQQCTEVGRVLSLAVCRGINALIIKIFPCYFAQDCEPKMNYMSILHGLLYVRGIRFL